MLGPIEISRVLDFLGFSLSQRSHLSPELFWGQLCRAARGDIVEFVAQVYDFIIVAFLWESRVVSPSACASYCNLNLL